MKKLLLPIFVSFAFLWYVQVLLIQILTVLLNIDEITWQWVIMRLQSNSFWMNILLGVIAFGVGVVINIFIAHIKKLEKKKILHILVIIVVMLVSIDQTVQLIMVRHHEAIGVIPLVEGWLEIRPIHVRQLAEYGFTGKGSMPIPVHLLLVGFVAIICYFLFRVIRHVCQSKSHLYASLVFYIAGIISSISNGIFHDLGYDFIYIHPIIIINIMDIYLYIGIALLIQACLVNYESLKPLKDKDLLPYLRYELGLIKNFVLRQGRAKAGGVQ